MNYMSNIVPTFRYFCLTLKHKWFVFLAGFRTKAKLRDLLLHDLSKFSWSELPNYGRQFFGKANDPEGFIEAWIHHQNRNKHHWEYWIPRTGHNRCTPPIPDGKPIPMPERYVREMLADWLGAGRAYTGKWSNPNHWEWLETARPKMVLHPETSHLINIVLSELR